MTLQLISIKIQLNHHCLWPRVPTARSFSNRWGRWDSGIGKALAFRPSCAANVAAEILPVHWFSRQILLVKIQSLEVKCTSLLLKVPVCPSHYYLNEQFSSVISPNFLCKLLLLLGTHHLECHLPCHTVMLPNLVQTILFSLQFLIVDGHLNCSYKKIYNNNMHIYCGWLRNPASPKGWLKPQKSWEKSPINWCRISLAHPQYLLRKHVCAVQLG